MRPSSSSRRRLVAALVLVHACAAAHASAQGRTDYFNVESPQVKPITVARVGGHDWLLICNTPDNSVEIWDTDESITPIADRFKLRIRVGLEPVSVKFNPANNRAYTADFLGDSVTTFALLIEDGTIAYRPIMTRHVGDEPVDIAFSSSGQELFVTHTTSGTFGWRNATTLDPVASIGGLDMAQIDLADSDTFASATKNLKEPRTVLASGSNLFVLGFKGGNAAALPDEFFAYDFDLYSRDTSTSPHTLRQLGNLGSTNFNMALAGNGDLWVVGAEAQNLTVDDETEARNEPTGFVKSTLYRVVGAGTASPTVTRIDLNDEDGLLTPVSPASTKALAQPTDVDTYRPGGLAYKVYFTAFGSDRVGVLNLTPPITVDPYGWPITRIPLPSASGPRGLVVKLANASDPDDPGARVYVLNRLANSFTIIDPTTDAVVATTPLDNDPTPAHIRDGRPFLYGASLSGNQFVSCASCHMDGRTDSLAWKLGTPDIDPALPYIEGFSDGIAEPDPFEFEKDKGAMVTQSLQGLLNFDVDMSAMRWFTNAPYHWRGDQPDLASFNAAFVNLMGATDLDPDPEVTIGIEPEDMDRLVDFANSIHYPPNPRQSDAREYSGDPVTDPLDPDSGTDAQRGLLLFHTEDLDLCSKRSCVQCHALPEGSNNRATVPTGLDSIESAAMRGLFQREARQDKDAGAPSGVVTANSGLTHLGLSASLNAFINRFTVEFDPLGTKFSGTLDGLLEVKQYAREFDWGVAPLVGRAYTVTYATTGTQETTDTLDLFEGQAARANVGVAVHVRKAGADSGYWLDPEPSPPLYRLEGGTTTHTRAALLALATGTRDRLVFIATPLGSERRVASVSGDPVVLTGSTPSDLVLLPARTNTANASIPSMRNNWDPFPTGTPLPTAFQWGNPQVPEPAFLKTVRLLQKGLIVDGAGQYGITETRHEAPRRFVVAGSGILPGAVLRLFVPDDATPPNPNGSLEQIETLELRLPLYPTDDVHGEEQLPVWETAVEIEPLYLYAFMLGGPQAQGVPGTLDPTNVHSITEDPYPTGLFDPDAANWHYVKVLNPDGVSEGDGGWQRLTVE